MSSDDETTLTDIPSARDADDFQIGRFFHLSELDCHDGTPYPWQWVGTRARPLVRVLDRVRKEWGGPLIVVSGYRSPAWNVRVGGAQLSQHVEGRAADVKPLASKSEAQERRVTRLHDMVMSLYQDGQIPELGGVGAYPRQGWVHVDVRPQRPQGHLAMWSGYGIGSEQSS